MEAQVSRKQHRAECQEGGGQGGQSEAPAKCQRALSHPGRWAKATAQGGGRRRSPGALPYNSTDCLSKKALQEGHQPRRQHVKRESLEQDLHYGRNLSATQKPPAQCPATRQSSAHQDLAPNPVPLVLGAASPEQVRNDPNPTSRELSGPGLSSFGSSNRFTFRITFLPKF